MNEDIIREKLPAEENAAEIVSEEKAFEEVKTKEAKTEEAQKEPKKSAYHTRHVIMKTGADIFSPMALIFGMYIILHGNISPGGGFQGGVLVASAVILIYMGYGYKTASKTFNLEWLHILEAVAAIIYIAIACMGIFAGGSFAQNVFYDLGETGELFSSGTVSYMNYAVGFKVFTGIAFLMLMMLSLLTPDADEEGEISEVLGK